MKFRNIVLSLIALSGLSANAALTVSGTRSVVITPAASTGLESVVVLENAAGATLTYTAASASAAAGAVWMQFGQSGGGYAEPMQGSSVSGSQCSVTIGAGDMGYIVNDGGRQTAYWVIDYSRHLPTMTAFAINPDSDCDRVSFTPTGGFDRINFYSVNGAPNVVDREIKLSFSDLEIEDAPQSDEEEGGDPSADATWRQYTHTVDLTDISGTFSVQAPLCDTRFELSGDRFLRAWGDPVDLSTDTYTTRRVDARTWAIQASRDNANESGAATSGLGGSAPCDITFAAVVTDAAVFTEWQFSATEDFADVLYRFSEPVFTYTFTEYGTTYVRFTCADASGECVYDGDVYTVMIGESKLLCPNAFSPHNQDGVNDEWKVSYSSLVSYDCHIFNRWGKQLFSSTNPAEGWDGRVGGKFVPAGVYFYVIKAEGADGVKYNLSGDINIVGSRLRPDVGGSDAGSEVVE